MLYAEKQTYEDLEKMLAKRYKEFCSNPKAIKKRVAINFPEPRYKITYICRYPAENNKDESDNQGYIYYKPLWAVIGHMYMFKSVPLKKKKSIWDGILFFFVSKTARGKAEIQIAQISLISILPLAIPILVLILFLLL
ncbi:hypothetical protein [Candidatus Epulonipiscium viviparus]|uniref:hypothetical protein n=1 Tax=Candidatus Epulonipiscium viviparus TaxID=420336 RepID=UPI002738124D|nr:hypothetical protein [Candidatus Epulopiscium viviparus]